MREPFPPIVNQSFLLPHSATSVSEPLPPSRATSPALPPIQLHALKDRSSFAALREEWNSLVQSTSHRYPYQTWEYLDAAWECFATPRLYPLILTAHDENGVLVGGMPLMIGWPDDFPRSWFRHLSFLGCHLGHQGEWADLLARPGAEDRVALGCARFLSGDRRSEWDVMAWSSVPADSVIFPKFTAALRFLGVDLQEHALESAPYIDLRHSGGPVEPASAKLRRNLRAQLRKIQDRIRIRLGGRDLSTREALEITLRLHNLRWDYDLEGGNHHDAFHLRLASYLEPQGQNFTLILDFDGEPAAATYGYIQNRTFYGILIGWDPNYRQYSMGHVILDATLREMRNLAVDRFEFLGGGGDYKKRWTSLESGYLRSEGINPHSLRARAYHLLRHLRDSWKAQPAPGTPAPDADESMAA